MPDFLVNKYLIHSALFRARCFQSVKEEEARLWMQSTFLNFYNVGLKNYLEFTIRKRNFLQKMYRENNWERRSQKKKYVYIFKFWHFYCKNAYIEQNSLREEKVWTLYK